MGQSGDSGMWSVAIREAQDVVPGDVIWAPGDGAWFGVHRVGGKRHPIFYRNDGSEASFDFDESNVLVRL